MTMKTKSIVLACGLAGILIAPAAFAQETPKPDKPSKAPKAATRIYVSSGNASYLGIGVLEVDAERAKAHNLKEERGVEIKSVEEDSPAAKAGIKEGDIVLEFNGQRVEGVEQFIRMVRETPPGRQCKLAVWRNGATQNLTATMGQRSGSLMAHSGDGSSFAITVPPMPPMPSMPPVPPLPDLPRSYMSWRSSVLGVESESLTPQLAEYFGVKEGVLVRSVVKNSAAEKAGIKAGDVIVKVDDTKVTSPREITSVLRGLRSKRTFPLVVVRKQQEMTLSVTLEDRSGMREPRPLRLNARFC
jgi:serine protease Do